MKRNLYDLTNEPFVMFVNRVGEVLRDEGISHNVVGGVGVQSYLLSMLTNKQGKNVVDLINDPNIRMQDIVRSTDDVDIALGFQGSDFDKITTIKGILPSLAYEGISPCGEYIIEFKSERVGVARPTFRVYVDGVGGQDDVISMNLSRGQNGDIRGLESSWYDVFLQDSRELQIPYCEGFGLRINVPRLEHLLAPKIAHSRPKDLMDTQNIAELAQESGVEIDFKEMERVLMPHHEDHYREFLSLGYPSQLESFDRKH